MKKVKFVLLLVGMVASSAAFAWGVAVWTGRSEPAASPAGVGYGYNCEYRFPNGNTGWAWFQGYCPATINL